MNLEEMVLKLALAAVAGGVVGLERERRDRPAGLRTHMVVCLGSTLITLVSLSLAGPDADRTRIAAQIVSGIGFLGAGTIFRSGSVVRGLTTAAGLWTVAGIGMAIAAGPPLLYLAVVAAALVFTINLCVRTVEDRWVRRYTDLAVTVTRGDGVIESLLRAVDEGAVRVDRVEWSRAAAAAGVEVEGAGERALEGDVAVVRLRLRDPAGSGARELLRRISGVEGVRSAEWE